MPVHYLSLCAQTSTAQPLNKHFLRRLGWAAWEMEMERVEHGASHTPALSFALEPVAAGLLTRPSLGPGFLNLMVGNWVGIIPIAPEKNGMQSPAAQLKQGQGPH